jgi:hypothetical protein
MTITGYSKFGNSERKGFSYEDKNSDEAGNHGGTSIVRWHGGLHCHNDPREYN